MAEDLLKLELTDHAEIAFSSLRPDDQRNISAWFQSLRRWRQDETLRSRARPLGGEDNVYIVPTNSDVYIAFRVADDELTIVSLLGKALLQAFQGAAGRATV